VLPKNALPKSGRLLNFGSMNATRALSPLLERMLGRTERSGALGFSVFRFAFFVPATKIEGDSRAGGAQFIGKSAVNHGPGHDHASYSQVSYALCSGATTAAILDQAPLQYAYHCFKHGLEGTPRTYAATSNVGRQCDHGARVLDVLEMLAR
jgi:hypothetical protein